MTQQPDHSSPRFLLWQQEGHLMEGCLIAAFHLLQNFSSRNISEKSLFYVVFFNYSAGLERLLKLILLLNQASNPGSPIDLKKIGHDLEELHELVLPLAYKHGVHVKPEFVNDALDRALLKFFTNFASSSRYFNLDSLSGQSKPSDPMKEWAEILRHILRSDLPPQRRIEAAAEVQDLLDSLPKCTIIYRETRLDGSPVSFTEACKEEAAMALALRETTWRLLKMLVPLKDLLNTLCWHLSSDDNIPYLVEFLDFVGPSRKFTVDDDNWPHFIR